MMFTKYVKVFDIGLQNTFVYRWNFLLRAVFGIVPLIGTVFLWKAVFNSKGSAINGYDYASMIFYFMLTVFLDNLITPTEDEWQIAAEIRDGRISAFLTKPMNYLSYRIMLFLSYRLLYIAVVFVPIIGLAWFFRGLPALPGARAHLAGLYDLDGHGGDFAVLHRLLAGHDRLLGPRNFDHRFPLFFHFEFFSPTRPRSSRSTSCPPLCRASCTGRRLPTNCFSRCRS